MQESSWIEPHPEEQAALLGRAQSVAIDEMKKTVGFKKRVDPKFQASLQYATPDPRTLVLNGRFEGKEIVATLRNGDEQTFLLISRGFHWINDEPFNR